MAHFLLNWHAVTLVNQTSPGPDNLGLHYVLYNSACSTGTLYMFA